MDLDKNFPRGQRRRLYLGYPQRLVGPVEQHSAHRTALGSLDETVADSLEFGTNFLADNAYILFID